jgi:hypothetical protein
MPKLKLDLDTLHVESFRTSSSAAGRGTVHGASGVEPVISDPVEHTGCTDECMSGPSDCPIESCGSSCDPWC